MKFEIQLLRHTAAVSDGERMENVLIITEGSTGQPCFSLTFKEGEMGRIHVGYVAVPSACLPLARTWLSLRELCMFLVVQVSCEESS